MTAILGPDGSPIQKKRAARTLRAWFDSAQSTNDNKNHWAAADSLSPNAAASPEVRRTLRNRSRYECKNNSYLKGMIQTKSNYIVGRGPRLQMTTGGIAERRELEQSWKQWSRQTGLAAKLRTMISSKMVDGEAFALYTNNRNQAPVQLGLRPLEADHISDPWWQYSQTNVRSRTERRLDGMRLDRNGNPTRYFILNHHPGADYFSASPMDGRWIPAEQVIHLYREDRAGQRRGVPYITPALPLFSILRRYTLASLSASEWSAELNAVMRSTASMSAEEADEVDELMEIPWARNMLLTLPVGWDIEQLKSEHPTTTFTEFYRQILNEAARCLEMPFNMAAANSADYNYASGRLDHQLFFKAIEIEIDELECNAVDPIFELWLREYLSEKSGIAPSDIDLTDYAHQWGWDGVEHVDPQKVATADQIYWNMGLLADEEYLIRRNIDPEEHYALLEKQNKRRKKSGLPLPGVAMQTIDTGQDDPGSSQPQEEDQPPVEEKVDDG